MTPDGSSPGQPLSLAAVGGAVVVAVGVLVGRRHRARPQPAPRQEGGPVEPKPPRAPHGPAPEEDPPRAAPADDRALSLRHFGRFSGAPWPEDTAGRWRCEITWHTDPVCSRFHAMAAPPGRAGAREIARSAAYAPLPHALAVPPTEELCTAVDRLASALLAAGWHPVMGGEGWFADRFVWRGDGDPPSERARVPDRQRFTDDAPGDG
jgi:hypothetical protein